jgi:FeS assembly SUF system regulator
MFKISRLTDYATSVVMYLQSCDQLCSTDSIAKAVNIELPTASKVLKLLVKANILASVRGANGGYRMADDSETVSLYDVIFAMEGSAAITNCLLQGSICSHESNCDAQMGWQQVNDEIKNILLKMTIKRMGQLNGVAKPDFKLVIKNHE